MKGEKQNQQVQIFIIFAEAFRLKNHSQHVKNKNIYTSKKFIHPQWARDVISTLKRSL